MSASAARSFVRACARGEAGRVGATRGGGAGRRGAAGGQVAGTPVLAALRSLASYSVPPLARRTYVALAPAPAPTPTPAPAAARYTHRATRARDPPQSRGFGVSRRPASRVDFGCGGFGAFEPAECFGIPCLEDRENDLSETHMLLEPRRRPL